VRAILVWRWLQVNGAGVRAASVASAARARLEFDGRRFWRRENAREDILAA
jgi:hypothetical protein